MIISMSMRRLGESLEFTSATMFERVGLENPLHERLPAGIRGVVINALLVQRLVAGQNSNYWRLATQRLDDNLELTSPPNV